MMSASILFSSLILMVKNNCKRNRKLVAFLCSYRVSKDSQASTKVLTLLTLKSCIFFMYNEIYGNAISSKSSIFSTSCGVIRSLKGLSTLLETTLERAMSKKDEFNFKFPNISISSVKISLPNSTQ